jgi:hypothetical protein
VSPSRRSVWSTGASLNTPEGERAASKLLCPADKTESVAGVRRARSRGFEADVRLGRKCCLRNRGLSRCRPLIGMSDPDSGDVRALNAVRFGGHYGAGRTLFRRKSREDSTDLAMILLQGRDMIAQTAQAHDAQCGIGSAGRFEYDGDAGVLTWIFADHVARAPVQIFGSYSETQRSWLWAWANEGLPASLRVASKTVRAWGVAHQQPVLTTGALDDFSAEQSVDLATIAFRLTEATGFYRAPSNGPVVFMSFGTVTIIGSDGTESSVNISVS